MAGKVKAKKVTVDGIQFDSQTEADYYEYLKGLRETGEIIHIQCHPKYILQPKCERYGRNYQPITYTADFQIQTSLGRIIVIDVKGYGMEDAILKRKMFAYQYPDMELRWIAASKKYSDTGWIDYDELMRLRRKAKREKKKQGAGGH